MIACLLAPSATFACSVSFAGLISLQFCLLLPARGVRSGERPSIKSPSRKTAPIDNRDDKAPNDFSRCLHRYQNRDHYIACLALPARPPLPRGQATSSVTNSVWIWMTSSSPSKSRTQRPTDPTEAEEAPFSLRRQQQQRCHRCQRSPSKTCGVSKEENRFPLVIIIIFLFFIHLSIRLKSYASSSSSSSSRLRFGPFL